MSRTVMSSVRLFFTTRYRMSSESGSGIDERAAPRSKCSNRPNVERTSTCLHNVLYQTASHSRPSGAPGVRL